MLLVGKTILENNTIEIVYGTYDFTTRHFRQTLVEQYVYETAKDAEEALRELIENTVRKHGPLFPMKQKFFVRIKPDDERWEDVSEEIQREDWRILEWGRDVVIKLPFHFR